VLGGVDCATGVTAEGSALGSQGEAAEGEPRHGTGRPGVRFSVSSVPGGVDCMCNQACKCGVIALGGCTGQSWRGSCGVLSAELGRALNGEGGISASAMLSGVDCAMVWSLRREKWAV
jgi:hypothetical protein